MVPLKREKDSTDDEVRVDLRAVAEGSENDASDSKGAKDCEDNLVEGWTVGRRVRLEVKWVLDGGTCLCKSFVAWHLPLDDVDAFQLAAMMA